MMKKIIVTVACTLIALLAFAQPGSKGTKATTEPITVTGTVIPSAIDEGAAASYQPAKTLVARVRVYYANMGDLRMIDHVVVLD
jgi:hypothetical protein